MNKVEIECMQCGYEQELTNWSVDDLGHHTSCVGCGGSFDIDEDDARAILIPIGTKIKFSNGETALIFENDFDDSEDFNNVNYRYILDKDRLSNSWHDICVMCSLQELIDDGMEIIGFEKEF